MATLTVRNLPESVRHALKRRAAHNDRSMEAEVRAILEDAVRVERGFVGEWLRIAEEYAGEPLDLPERSRAREVDLG